MEWRTPGCCCSSVTLREPTTNAPPTLKDPKFLTAEEKKTRKIDRLARSLLIQVLPNDIYSLIDSNDTAKDLWDDLERQNAEMFIINDYDDVGSLRQEGIFGVFVLDTQKICLALIFTINRSSKEFHRERECEFDEILRLDSKHIIEPANVAEALKDVYWVSAMQDELD
ncbi:hypothetical protein Tco_1312807 [Tanacetum coccineum]